MSSIETWRTSSAGHIAEEKRARFLPVPRRDGEIRRHIAPGLVVEPRWDILSYDESMVLIYILRYIDGIHGTPYIAAPWILWVSICFLGANHGTK